VGEGKHKQYFKDYIVITDALKQGCSHVLFHQ